MRVAGQSSGEGCDRGRRWMGRDGITVWMVDDAVRSCEPLVNLVDVRSVAWRAAPYLSRSSVVQ